MNGPKDTKVLVDTCFLISLVNDDDAQHQSAEEYFRHFLSSDVELYMSMITLSEFQQRQQPEIIENFQLISFGINEVAAQHKHFGRSDVSGLSSEQKVLVKDDVKILATVLAHEIEAVASVNDDFCKLAVSKGIRVIDYKVALTTYLGQLPLPSTK